MWVPYVEYLQCLFGYKTSDKKIYVVYCVVGCEKKMEEKWMKMFFEYFRQLSCDFSQCIHWHFHTPKLLLYIHENAQRPFPLFFLIHWLVFSFFSRHHLTKCLSAKKNYLVFSLKKASNTRQHSNKKKQHVNIFCVDGSPKERKRNASAYFLRVIFIATGNEFYMYTHFHIIANHTVDEGTWNEGKFPSMILIVMFLLAKLALNFCREVTTTTIDWFRKNFIQDLEIKI